MTTGKTIALTRWTFVDKVMSLLFNMLSRLVSAFLPSSKCLGRKYDEMPHPIHLIVRSQRVKKLLEVSEKRNKFSLKPNLKNQYFQGLGMNENIILKIYIFCNRIDYFEMYE